MKKERKKGSGGKRAGFVKPKRYGEKSTTVFGVRVPESKEKEYRLWHSKEVKPLIENKLKTWQVSRETPNK